MNRLLKAAHFAARKHANQRRKDAEESPYINHPLEVAEHLARVGEIEDEEILMAALLHDTIEDTETTKDEIASEFGEEVANLVLECTDDKSLSKKERKHLQIVNATKKSSKAKMIKIADKTCNLRSILDDSPRGWTIRQQREYFLWAKRVVAGLSGVNEALDEALHAVLQEGLEKLKET